MELDGSDIDFLVEKGKSCFGELFAVDFLAVKNFFSGWPLVGNEGINLYMGILGIHSLIPY